jgi:hypothetical protein
MPITKRLTQHPKWATVFADGRGSHMLTKTGGFGVLARGFAFGALAMVLSGEAPASAQTAARAASLELSAQTTRPRITIYPRRVYPGRNAKRQCRSTLVQEYRVSGPVIVPHTQCWWE